MEGLALAVTVHDPDERMLARFEPGLAELVLCYGVKAASCSEATSPRTIAALHDAGFRTKHDGRGEIGRARRESVAMALTGGWVHYIDLDRLLHWQQAYPEELAATLAAMPRSEFVALGRTARALATHPRVQILAETLTNAAFGAALRLEGETDLVAGSCMLSQRVARMLLSLSTEPTNATDLEWPALVVREFGVLPEFRALEGLEFETADYYAPEIERAGSLSAWLHETYDTPEVWAARSRLALDSIAALARVLPAGR